MWIGLREVVAEVNASALGASGGGGGHQPRNEQQILQLPAFELSEFSRRAVPAHQALQGVREVGQVEIAIVPHVLRPIGSQRNRREAVGLSEREFRGFASATKAVNQSFQQTVGGESVCSVQAGRRYFAGRP